MRTIIMFLYFAAYLIYALPAMWRAQSLAKRGDTAGVDRILNIHVTRWARTLLRLAGTRVIVEGQENLPKEGAVLYVSNHQGDFDIPVLLTHLDGPHAFVAKKELLKVPLVKYWMSLLQCVFLDRDHPRQALASILKSVDTLKGGHSVIIFPEGTRSRGRKMGEFKFGAMKIAQRAQVPIIPLAVDGSFRVMEQQGIWVKPATVRLKILPPLDTAGLTREDAAAMNDRIYQLIAEALQENC
ncbi:MULTISPECIES: lysophospholipid acyltransferase family protein [unclassified Clostridium]|uniref:lysophospholipid acyltransferase family protein n=1 Tax=unclassified Clostridium TaxID=2614128 RepID=UPI000821A55F|nr:MULTISPECIES: lysophospholipid acyltransferase family protein [unclassified Clostridium]SCI86725.1 1-acyl-sn-glycerol-3-phosphate acyltransferase [uncultured Clostridium sp.]